MWVNIRYIIDFTHTNDIKLDIKHTSLDKSLIILRIRALNSTKTKPIDLARVLKLSNSRCWLSLAHHNTRHRYSRAQERAQSSCYYDRREV